MYLSSILNTLLVGTAILIASTPNAQCHAAHLRAASSSEPSTDEMVYAEKTSWESSSPQPKPKYTSNKEPGYGYDEPGYGYDHKEPGYNHKDASYGHDSNYAPPSNKYYYPPKSDTKLAEDLEMAATATTSHHCQRGYKKVCHKKCHHHRCHHVCKCVRHWANDDWENELQEMAVHAPTATSRSGKSGKRDNNKKASSFYDYGEDSSSSNDDIEESSMIMMQSYDSENSESGDSISDADASEDVVFVVF